MKLLHTLMALVLVLACGLYGFFVGNPWGWWLGASAASAYFAGREIAQAEYRWIERHGLGLRANMAWSSIWTTPGIWSEKSWMWDWALPSLVSFVVAFQHARIEQLIFRLIAS